MPRFFFHTDDGHRIVDDEGVELPTMLEARYEAARVLGEMLKEQPDAFWRDDGLSLTVTDERGLMLFALQVSTAVAPAGGKPSPTSLRGV